MPRRLSHNPFAGTQGVDATLFAEGQPFDESANPLVNYEGADPSYFATLGLPILRGRGIEGRDRAGSEPVVAVNEAFARLFWPGRDPIGRRIKWGSSKSKSQWRTVVGLVANARYRELTNVRPSIYVPYGQGIPVSPGYLAVRANSPASVAGAIRRAVADQEPGASVVSIEPLPHLHRSTRTHWHGGGVACRRFRRDAAADTVGYAHRSTACSAQRVDNAFENWAIRNVLRDLFSGRREGPRVDLGDPRSTRQERPRAVHEILRVGEVLGRLA